MTISATRFIQCIIFLVCLYGVYSVHGEITLHAQSAENISVSVIPEHPKPGESFSVRLNSYLYDLDTFSVSWYRDGVLELSGEGRKDYAGKAGGQGTTTTIDILIFASGTTIKKKIVIQPGQIDLLYEPVGSYTPLFYKGRALPTAQGGIRVFALPDTVRTIDEHKNLIYTWRLNGKAMEAQSGAGRASITIQKDLFREGNTVEVIAYNSARTVQYTGSITIPSFQPVLMFYAMNDKNYIDYTQAFTGTIEIPPGSKKNIIIEPFFFDVKTKNKTQNEFARLRYVGSLNGKDIRIPMGNTKKIFEFKAPQGGGYAIFNIQAENILNLVESATKNIQLIYLP